MKSFVPLALLASSAFAKTDLDGCTSFTSKVTVRPEPGYGNTYDSIVYYVSDTLEICKGVDCGGGRAPPKSIPGCPLYEGTETVTAEFLDSDPMKPTEAPESSIVKATSPETSTIAEETETTTVETATATETRAVGTATAPDMSSETRSVGTATAPDSSTITSMVTTTATTATIATTVTTGESENTTEGGEGDDASATSGTDTPDAAMPTAAVAQYVVAGVAAAVAFL